MGVPITKGTAISGMRNAILFPSWEHRLQPHKIKVIICSFLIPAVHSIDSDFTFRLDFLNYVISKAGKEKNFV